MCQLEIKLLSLLNQADHWEVRGMWEVADIYYKEAAKVELQLAREREAC